MFVLSYPDKDDEKDIAKNIPSSIIVVQTNKDTKLNITYVKLLFTHSEIRQ